MFQLGTAIELNVAGNAYTLSFGWGTSNVEGLQWHVPLFGLFNQKASGASRYGVVVLGFYASLQVMNVARAVAEVQRQMGGGAKPPSARASGLRGSTAMTPQSAPKVVVKQAPAPDAASARGPDVV